MIKLEILLVHVACGLQWASGKVDIGPGGGNSQQTHQEVFQPEKSLDTYTSPVLEMNNKTRVPTESAAAACHGFGLEKGPPPHWSLAGFIRN
jgi:hypothetical protein